MLKTWSLLLLLGAAAPAADLDKNLAEIARSIPGRIGVCVQSAKGVSCVRADEPFPLQSVMKLVVGVAVLDAVDRRGWKLDEAVVLHKQDLSLYQQPIAALVGPNGYRTTIGDLVRRAIIDSDSAAVDNLIAKLGGCGVVQEVLRRKGVKGIRVDRNERDLQTEIVGLTWKPEYVDAAVLDKAIAAVPDAKRSASYGAYQKDLRDTATPRGMAAFLLDLAQGKLLSPSSTAFVMQAMKDCATGTDRLKAGVAPGWQLAHKTGTSGSWKGMTAATNDEGVLIAPDGSRIAVAVFVADSPATPEVRAAVIAKIAAAVIQDHR
jgi:beta-lactamase class A